MRGKKSIVIAIGVVALVMLLHTSCGKDVPVEVISKLTSAIRLSATSLDEEYIDTPSPVSYVAYSDEYECTYAVREDGTVSFESYKGTGDEYLVPDEINGLPVTRISKGAFYSQTLRVVTVSDSVETIEGGAFYRCRELRKIVLGSSVKKIVGNPSPFCYNLDDFECHTPHYSFKDHCLVSKDKELVYVTSRGRYATIPKGIKSIGEKALYGLPIKTITIPKSVVKIGAGAFKECQDLTEVVFAGERVKEIGDQAFYGCPLERIELPSSLKMIGEEVFWGAKFETLSIPKGTTKIKGNPIAYTGVKVIDIHANPHFVIQDGALISKEDQELICFLPVSQEVSEYVIPHGIRTIASRAFADSPIGLIIIPSTVTKIEDYAFASSNITYVTIPDSVIAIGDYAFSGCRRLEKIHLSKNLKELGVGAFSACWSLRNIEIPFLVTVIPEDCFRSCELLETIDLPPKLVAIGASAFSACRSLRNIEIPFLVTVIPENCFGFCLSLETIDLPSKLIAIGVGAFRYTSLESIHLPQSLRELGDGVFESCGRLKHIEVPPLIQIIPDGCFSSCSRLETIVLPDSVKTIGAGAFEDCRDLRKISIPDGTAVIEASTFSGCTELWDIRIPETVKAIGEKAFYDSGLYRIDLPKGLESIDDQAFMMCNDLEAIIIPENTVLHGNPFGRCWRLAYVEVRNPRYTFEDGVLCSLEDGRLINVFDKLFNQSEFMIPEGIVTIENYAFADCESLEVLIVPDSVKSIGKSAFLWCENLKQAIVPASTEIGRDAFLYCHESLSIEEV